MGEQDKQDRLRRQDMHDKEEFIILHILPPKAILHILLSYYFLNSLL